jgi:hypothetical protein
MGVLAADKNILVKAAERALRTAIGAVASDIIYARAIVGLSSGTGRPLTAGDDFLGIAQRQVDNSAGAASAQLIDLESGLLVKVTISGTSSADIGKTVYATNDNLDDLTLTKGSNSPIGVYEFPESGTSFWLRLFTPGEAKSIKLLEARVTVVEA